MAIRIEELKDKLIPMSRSIQGELNPGTDEGRNIVSKGLLLFRQNLVSNVKVRDEEASADVQDVTPVSVRLDLQFPLLSRCSCPYSGWCRHRMATFFMLYNKVARVSEWIQDWRSQESSPAADADDKSSLNELLKKHGGTGALRKASDLLQERKSRGNTPEEWWMFFETLLQKEDLQLLERQPYLMDVIIQNIYKRFNKEAPFEREWKPLYQLFTTFFLTLRVDLFLQKKNIELNREQYALFDFLLDQMEDAIEKLSVHAMPFSFDPFIAFLKERSAEMSEDPNHSTTVKSEVYRFIWYYLFKQKAWRRDEVKRLEASETPEDLFIQIAILHQYLLLEEIEKADEMVERIGTELVVYSEFWLVKFVLSKRYEALLLLLKAILKRLPVYIQERDHYEASSFVRWFVRKLPAEWLMERDPHFLRELLLSMLPFSYYSYTEFLLQTRSYREWVELQKYMGYSIPEMENVGLPQVYKESPELALPLYYNGVVDAIEQKNRDSYRQAVRYMKKIRTIYKKLKQTDKWDAYLDYILEKYKRLRAFQEECRKGKLIDA
jgi:SWIM zinc finger